LFCSPVRTVRFIDEFTFAVYKDAEKCTIHKKWFVIDVKLLILIFSILQVSAECAFSRYSNTNQVAVIKLLLKRIVVKCVLFAYYWLYIYNGRLWICVVLISCMQWNCDVSSRLFIDGCCYYRTNKQWFYDHFQSVIYQ